MAVRALFVAAPLLFCLACSTAEPERRAVDFLAREVPGWPVKNKCFSCHNNGDAARALFEARRRSLPFDPRALESTERWLSRPGDWKDAGPPGEFSDKKLAALQFAFALSTADEAGEATLSRAAALVRDQQEPDGSWAVDAGGLAGSPVTYGRTLATVAARQVLARAGAHFAGALARTDGWLLRQRPVTVLDAGALLLGLVDPQQRWACLEVIRRGEFKEGGWGPYVTSPPEVFDTAIVLLGLAGIAGGEGIPEMRRRGRTFLLNSQQADGSWPETTRPSGGESYAQRISTTAWATLALLATP
jgi:hypothetical protein